MEERPPATEADREGVEDEVGKVEDRPVEGGFAGSSAEAGAGAGAGNGASFARSGDAAWKSPQSPLKSPSSACSIRSAPDPAPAAADPLAWRMRRWLSPERTSDGWNGSLKMLDSAGGDDGECTDDEVPRSMRVERRRGGEKDVCEPPREGLRCSERGMGTLDAALGKEAGSSENAPGGAAETGGGEGEAKGPRERSCRMRLLRSSCARTARASGPGSAGGPRSDDDEAEADEEAEVEPPKERVPRSPPSGSWPGRTSLMCTGCCALGTGGGAIEDDEDGAADG